MSKVLVVNTNGRPHDVVTLKQAWGLIEDNVVYPATDELAGVLRSAHATWEIPSVLILKRYKHVPDPNKAKSWSKKGVLERDNFTCAYCGTEFFGSDRNQLTVDHVVPQSRGGPDTWGNTVCACFSCNQRKADKTMKEAGMKFIEGYEPKIPRGNFIVIKGNVPKSWKVFLKT